MWVWSSNDQIDHIIDWKYANDGSDKDQQKEIPIEV